MRAWLGRAAGALAFGVFGVGVALASAACGSSGSTPADNPDATTDAQVEPDAPIQPPDAGSDVVADAKKDVVPAGGRYCEKLMPAPKFCDDFDDNGLTDDWTQSAVVPGNVFALDEGSFTSPPASFRVKTGTVLATVANNVLLRATMFGAVSRGKLAFSTFLPSVTFTKGTIAIAQFYVTLNDVFTLYLRDGDTTAPAAVLMEEVGGVTKRHVLTKLPPTKVWTRVVIDLDLVGGKATVMFDAQKALDADPIAVGTGSEATVRLGAIIDGPSDPFEAGFDDVTVDF